MIGVVLQHVRGYAYSNDKIFYSVWFAVALFLIIGGYNLMGSWLTRGVIVFRKRLKRIFFPYVLTTMMYVLFLHHFFNAETLLMYLLHFNGPEPLYYVAVYTQLVFVTPLLIGIIRWCNSRKTRYIFAWIFVLMTCYFSMHFSNLFDIRFGGGNLFGGSWLMFWFAGMCIRGLDIRIETLKGKSVAFFCGTIILIGWQWVFVLKGYNCSLPSIFDGNKMGLTWANTVETVLLFFWLRETVELAEMFWGTIVQKCLQLIGFVGKHSLYVFMYHVLFLEVYKKYLHIYFGAKMSLLFIIFAPIALEYCFTMIQKFANKLMRGIRVDDTVL